MRERHARLVALWRLGGAAKQEKSMAALRKEMGELSKWVAMSIHAYMHAGRQ